jgi:hypothetical protein
MLAGGVCQMQDTEIAGEPDPLLVVAPDRHGHWLVQETHGLFGGLFTSFEGAMRFARDECRALPRARLKFADRPAPVGPWA